MKEKLTKYTSTWKAHHAEKNPDRKWYQFWKPKYIWVESKQPLSEYKIENGKVTVRFKV